MCNFSATITSQKGITRIMTMCSRNCVLSVYALYLMKNLFSAIYKVCSIKSATSAMLFRTSFGSSKSLSYVFPTIIWILHFWTYYSYCYSYIVLYVTNNIWMQKLHAKLSAYGMHAFPELSHCPSLVGQTTDLNTADIILLLLSQVHTVMGQIISNWEISAYH